MKKVRYKKFEMKGSLPMKGSLQKRVKRGEQSWSFIWIVYAILLAVTLSIISATPFTWFWKILVLISSVFLLSWLCLLNGWFQNKIMGLKIKLEDTWRKI